MSELLGFEINLIKFRPDRLYYMILRFNSNTIISNHESGRICTDVKMADIRNLLITYEIKMTVKLRPWKSIRYGKKKEPESSGVNAHVVELVYGEKIRRLE